MADRDPVQAPVLARPRRFHGSLSFRQFVRAMRDSSIATHAEEVFDSEVSERRLLWRRYLLVNAPDGIRHVLVDNAANYQKSPLARQLLEPALGCGLITSEGETWRRHRRIMAPAFNHTSLARLAPRMTEAISRMLADWERLPQGAELDVSAEMMHLTLRIIARTMFSSDYDALLATIEASVARYQKAVRPGILDLLGFPAWLPRLSRRRGRRAMAGADKAIAALIARHDSHHGSDQDFLGILLAAGAQRGGAGLAAPEIRDEVVTILTAGHETTAQALGWTWYLLALHPAAEVELHAELDRVLAGRDPGFADLDRLPYARMVVEEAMRLYPPAHTLSRQALAADVIAGHHVSPGSVILIVPWVLHRHRRLWDNPEIFDPSRFRPESVALRRRFAYLPFGTGPRICLGASFAMTEAVLALAQIAQRYRLRLVRGPAVEPVGLITLRPRHGLRMTISRR
jgi:cytochrome P450